MTEVKQVESTSQLVKLTFDWQNRNLGSSHEFPIYTNPIGHIKMTRKILS